MFVITDCAKRLKKMLEEVSRKEDGAKDQTGSCDRVPKPTKVIEFYIVPAGGAVSMGGVLLSTLRANKL